MASVVTLEQREKALKNALNGKVLPPTTNLQPYKWQKPV